MQKVLKIWSLLVCLSVLVAFKITKIDISCIITCDSGPYWSNFITCIRIYNAKGKKKSWSREILIQKAPLPFVHSHSVSYGWFKRRLVDFLSIYSVQYSMGKNSQVSRELSSRRDGCRLRSLTTHAIFPFCLIYQFFSHTFRVSKNFHFASSWKISRRKVSSKITMSCSILTFSSWRHLKRYFRHHVSLDLFVDFVPFSE